MPWWAMNFDLRELKKSVADKYEIRGVPFLVCLKTDGSQVNKNFRNDVTLNKAAALEALI